MPHTRCEVRKNKTVAQKQIAKTDTRRGFLFQNLAQEHCITHSLWGKKQTLTKSKNGQRKRTRIQQDECETRAHTHGGHDRGALPTGRTQTPAGARGERTAPRALERLSESHLLENRHLPAQCCVSPRVPSRRAECRSHFGLFCAGNSLKHHPNSGQ